MLAAGPRKSTQSRQQLRSAHGEEPAIAGWIETEITAKVSPRSVTDTVSRLTGILSARGLKVFAVIDQSAEASQVGLQLRETTAAAEVGLPAVAEASFGIGIGCWLLLGSTVWTRLLFRPALPPALVPTLAIELAPPAVAGAAYFALTGGAMNFTARALGGFCVLMALMQLRFIPLYASLRFSPGFWAFAFAYAAAATDALLWITLARPPGATGYAITVVTLITVFIAALGARTLIAAVRGQLLPEERR